MSHVSLEMYLARLYTDAVARECFLADPQAAARAAGVSDEDVVALMQIDRSGLRMAAASYARKREQHRLPKRTLAELFRRWVGR